MEIYEINEEIIREIELLDKENIISKFGCFLLKHYKGNLKDLLIIPKSFIKDGILLGDLSSTNLSYALSLLNENKLSRLDAKFFWRNKETIIQYDNYVGRDNELNKEINKYESLIYHIRKNHMNDSDYDTIAYFIDNLKSRFDKAFIYLKTTKIDKKITFIN